MDSGARLREERTRLGLTQTAFGEIGGVKRVTQHMYEQDDRAPNVNYLLRLQEHGVDVGFLMSGRRSIGGQVENPIPRHRAVMAFRVVEEFSNSRGDGPLAYADRERLFESLCATFADRT